VKELIAGLSLLRMQRGLRLPPDVLLEEQTRKLRRTIHHAYSTTPYYRKLLDAAGLRPQDIPITRKQDLLVVPLEERVAEGTDINKCHKSVTSGSMGARFELRMAPKERLRRILADVRAFLANGCSVWDTMCASSSRREIHEPAYWFQRLGLLRRRHVSVFNDLENKLRTLTAGNYDIIYWLTSDLVLLAEAMLERGIGVAPPNMVVTNGEMMNPTQQCTIEQAFGRAPTDFYGCAEFWTVAWQCRERRGYHINADLLLLELVRDGNVVEPGEEGEIVVTDLMPRAMPLIRYATGDWARSATAPCPCGITLPTLAHIGGRILDFLVLPSGKKISPYVVLLTVSPIKGIKEYHLVQKSRSEVLVRFSRHPHAKEVPSPALLQTVRSLVGESMEIRLEEVDRIERPSGKFRVVENELLRAGDSVQRAT